MRSDLRDMAKSNTIPVTVLSGYLGAGKTTRLNRLLAGDHGLRIGVLVNDFGAINVDENLIDFRDGMTVGLTNGCVCCSIEDDLGQALDTISTVEPPLDGVVIETSGVADPARVAAYANTWPGFSLNKTVTVVDVTRAEALLEDKYVGATFRRQIEAADEVDLAHTDRRDDCSPDPEALMDHVIGIPSGVLPAMSLLEPVTQGGRTLEPSQHSDHHETMTVDLPCAVSMQALTSMLSTMPDAVRRCKGFVDVSARDGTSRQVVQYIPGYWSVEPAEAKQELLLTQVTLIWTGSLWSRSDLKAWLLEQLAIHA